jgi:carbon-monoxide dehydrogenase large subunit
MNAPEPGLARGIGAGRYIGKRVHRKEDQRLLTGRGQFVDDVSLPGMLHVAFVRSPIARGTILSIDMATALSVPGVHAIYTQDDLADAGVTLMSFFFTQMEVETTLLANGRVMHVGDPVALVIADSRAIAEDGAALVEVEYEELDPVVTIDDAKAGPPIHPGTGTNLSASMGDEDIDEDLAAAIGAAAHVIEHHVTHARVSQSPMETRGVIASKDGAGELMLYITCQSPTNIARWIGMALGQPELAVRVIAKDVGGSFGLKNTPWREEVSTIVAAMKFGRPLKWIEDRYENLTAANQAREQQATLRIGFDATGKLLASHCDYDSNNGAYPQGADANVAVQMFMWAAYKMPAFGFITRGWYSNTIGLAAYRGPWALESLVRETALDVAARRMGIDPVELRRRNLVYLSDQPTASILGLPLEDITPGECLEKLVANFDIPAFRREQAEARKAGRYIGLGIATYIEPTGSAGSMAPMTGELAQIRIEPTGQVTATMSTHSQGHGTQTTMAQVIADRLGVAYEMVNVQEGDSRGSGFSPGAAGSRQGVIAGGAAIKASDILAEKVKGFAAHILNASVDSIRIEDGMIHVEGAEEMSRPLAEIAAIAYGEPHRLPPGAEPGLEAQFRYQPPPMTYTSAANLCTVEVDIDTGFVTITRWVGAEDCGTVINPAVVEGQIAGGLAQAIGTVLLEDMHFDARGNPTTTTYKDYLLPSISDVPVFEYIHANTPSQTVGGMRGVGEGGAIIGPPTLVNAIADALSPFGELKVSLPLTPPRILDLIEGRDISGAAGHGDAASAPPPAETAAPIGPHGEGLPSVDAVVLPGGVPEAAAAPATIAGEWAMTIKAPMGGQEMTAVFRTDGDALSGELLSDQGNSAFAGTVEGNRLKWEMKVEQPMKMTLKYDLIIEGDALSGKMKMGLLGSAKVTGTRLS